jgi:hypothetical protein
VSTDAPDRQPSDAAVEATALAMFADEHCDKRQMQDVLGNWNSRLNGEDQALYRSMARAALVAAYRVDAARPLLDREALTRAFMAFRERNGGCPEGPDCAACREIAAEEADLALELAQPMPTADDMDALLWAHRTVASNGTQTVCACDRTWRSDTEHRTHLRDRFMALLNGETDA